MTEPASENLLINCTSVSNAPYCDAALFNFKGNSIITAPHFPEAGERLAQSLAVLGGFSRQSVAYRAQYALAHVLRHVVEVVGNDFWPKVDGKQGYFTLYRLRTSSRGIDFDRLFRRPATIASSPASSDNSSAWTIKSRAFCERETPSRFARPSTARKTGFSRTVNILGFVAGILHLQYMKYSTSVSPSQRWSSSNDAWPATRPCGPLRATFRRSRRMQGLHVCEGSK